MAAAVYDIPVKRIDGTPASLADHKGNVLLIVNVASKCGLTPQYTELEEIYETYRDRGFAVLGFPANEFAGQEPGSNDEIQQFCQTKFGIKFPMFEKIVVKGDGQHPLYQSLIEAKPNAQQNPKGFATQDPRSAWTRAQERYRHHVELREISREPQRRSRRAFCAGLRSQGSGNHECDRIRIGKVS